jgi:hypothetical protein
MLSEEDCYYAREITADGKGQAIRNRCGAHSESNAAKPPSTISVRIK